MSSLYDKYIELLIEVNDENKSKPEHRQLEIEFCAWKQGVEDATGRRFNGDYYYIDKGINRPMCCGSFLDWESKL